MKNEPDGMALNNSEEDVLRHFESFWIFQHVKKLQGKVDILAVDRDIQ